MKRSKTTCVGILALTVLLVTVRAQAQVTQTFTLKPGWNAVFLEIQPEPRDPASVFAGLPQLDSVWTWLSRESTAEFIQNPDEGLWGEPGWHAYFTSEKESFLTNLFAVLGNQSYLVKMKASAPAETPWIVGGNPSVRKIRWLPKSFNLVGFHLAPDNPPTFQTFFAPSSAHTGTGQAMYRFSNQSGKWESVENPATAKLAAGEAYWVYCEGSSTYQGPLRVDLPMSDGLNYGASLTRLTVTLNNISEVGRTVGLSLAGGVVLYYREYDPTAGYFTWHPLGQMSPIALDPGHSQNVWLEVRRNQMTTGVSQSVLTIADDKGIRIQVPVSAERIQ